VSRRRTAGIIDGGAQLCVGEPFDDEVTDNPSVSSSATPEYERALAMHGKSAARMV
jgi:hypothetical protein